VFRDFFATLLQPEFRPIFGSAVIVLTVGTLVFRELEGWSLLDSLYFSVVTLATVGYGDLTPTTDVAKLFSIIYIFVGVGILGVFISTVSRASMQRTIERKERRAAGRTAAREEHLEQEL
jgi:hypothetical protein